MPAVKKETAEDKAKREAAEQAERDWAALVARATDEDSSAARQIRRAIELERESASIRKRVNDNRDYLRLMDRNDELNDDQAEFLETFYPEKEKGSVRPADEVEATRRAREAARKGINGVVTDEGDDD